MQKFRSFFVCGGLLLAGTCLGCNEDLPGNCPKPLGVYMAEYSMLSGTCQPGYQPHALKFAADDQTSTILIEKRLGDVVTTETLLKGCELRVGQRVSGESATRGGGILTRSSIAGTLGVVGEGSLSGTIERTDFTESGQPSCTAQYDAWYTRDELLLGAAARE